MLTFLLTFLIAFILTILLTPVVRTFAPEIGAVDKPSERKIHSVNVPRTGGMAIYFGFLAAILFGLLSGGVSGAVINPRPVLGILLGGSIILLTGLLDDIRQLKPLTKLFGQITGAAVAAYFGIGITFLSSPFGGTVSLGYVTIPLTLLWLVGITNAINLIDGLDGLAAGVTAIAAITFFFVALRTHQLEAALLMLALAGTALGFLRYNFFPASIFLGDAGSYFLGFVLAAAAIVGVFKTTLVVALVIPLLILGVPIFDTVFALWRRLKEKKNPFAADDKHIHHLLLRAGFSQREAVFAIYTVCFLLSFIALIMALQK
ncbi:undecaprenyl/decaprenyl-phosphate alpha-N-acetylglucosaminyl 1-phosphate transferase [Candidatus Saganbacteria bacterium]|uniref:Undecaprenyl/decaprenyl-phosphate alpha-N-acetylglucosaminyl 1-phosphate transferase n=1 Tax=Candidatus Saganbacteria bacterium TaxID=2575572 RepID=A0A9D6YVY0_UNCSA|nr:undecaprenyl/decaprenyl-phosphate alpha-N-acetylglucosaminyl 1-phosphate transferase [Candidatus Saganbacteria bacterium]